MHRYAHLYKEAVPPPMSTPMSTPMDGPLINKGRTTYHGLVAGFHRSQATNLEDKDPEASKYHLLAAHAHEAAKYQHKERLPSAEASSAAAQDATTMALSPDARSGLANAKMKTKAKKED
jgi:hypothetical protein